MLSKRSVVTFENRDKRSDELVKNNPYYIGYYVYKDNYPSSQNILDNTASLTEIERNALDNAIYDALREQGENENNEDANQELASEIEDDIVVDLLAHKEYGLKFATYNTQKSAYNINAFLEENQNIDIILI